MKNSPNAVDYMYIRTVDEYTACYEQDVPYYFGLPGRRATVAYRVVEEAEDDFEPSLTFEVNVAVQSKKDPFNKRLGRMIATNRFNGSKNQNYLFTVIGGPGAMYRLRQAIVESDLIPVSFRNEFYRYGV